MARVTRPRAALYHRPSIIERTPWRELRAAAAARGYGVAMEIEETESAHGGCPALERLLTAARERKIDAVLVQKLHAFGYTVPDLLSIIRKLVDSGTRVEVVAQRITIDPRDEESTQAILGVLAALADAGRSARSDATRVGLERARRRGHRLGRPPLPKRDP
ncbi:MAG: recombinase family protein [Planctomycetes bacterium]|nr:recombinase family protein [Planctomycetota bacterium]